MKIFGRLLNDKSDPEKAVLPTIIFINLSHPFFTSKVKGFAVGVGWWHYAIMFGILTNVKHNTEFKL